MSFFFNIFFSFFFENPIRKLILLRISKDKKNNDGTQSFHIYLPLSTFTSNIQCNIWDTLLYKYWTITFPVRFFLCSVSAIDIEDSQVESFCCVKIFSFHYCNAFYLRLLVIFFFFFCEFNSQHKMQLNSYTIQENLKKSFNEKVEHSINQR